MLNQLKQLNIRNGKWEKNFSRLSTLMNKILELIEAQNYLICQRKIRYFNSSQFIVHAIIEFKNGLKEFIYHETSMVIPLANAIFGGKLNIKDFYKLKQDEKNIKKFDFKKVDKEFFQLFN